MAKRPDRDFPFLSHLDGLLTELYDNVPGALKEFDGDAIHDARVATRRLKAAIDLLGGVLSDHRRRPFARALKKLRRRLGPLRDADVMIERLTQLSEHPSVGSASKWLRDRLIQSRQDARQRSSQRQSTPADVLEGLGPWWGVREEIQEAREAIDSLLAESLHLRIDAFAERADHLASRLAHPPVKHETQDPHALRIAGKLLRYTLELAAAQGHRLPASVTRTFKQMQDALGNWHDDVVLIECAMQTGLDQKTAYHDLVRQRELVELSKLLIRRAGRELDQFARLWQLQGASIDLTIRETFPLTRAIETPPALRGSQTGPDPSGSDEQSGPATPPPDVASSV